MKETTLDNLPEETRKKVIQARKAYRIATEIGELLNLNFSICNLNVASTFDKTVSISGLIDSLNIKEDVTHFLSKSEKVNHLINNLTVVENEIEKTIVINNKTYLVSSLNQIKQVFEIYKNIEYIECCLNGSDETGIIVLMNSTHSLGIFYRYEGDSGFTTYNSNGNKNNIQNFKLSNGQLDEYNESMLIEKELGFELLKFYLLKSEMYPEIEWKEE